MPRRARVVLPVLAPLAALLLAGCGGDPEALEPLPPPAPEDLCALVPEDVVGDLQRSASRSDAGDPTATCALRDPSGDAVLVTWLQLQNDDEATTAYESQCAAIDTRALSEEAASVEGATETCAARGDVAGGERVSLAVLAGREVLTVRATLAEGDTLARSVRAAEGVLADLPRPE